MTTIFDTIFDNVDYFMLGLIVMILITAVVLCTLVGLGKIIILVAQ
jgi:hypothetical protein